MKISFDYDGTLTNERGREIALKAIEEDHDVYIVTARTDNRMRPVYELAEELDLDDDHVINTSNADKWRAIAEHEIEIHYDNNEEQVKKINERTTASGVLLD